MISLPVTFAINLIAEWQSPQTRKFFITLIGIPLGTFRSPYATASFSL